MKVFLSWSGDMSKSIAQVFRDWLPSVIQSVEPMFSDEDIHKGQPWLTRIFEELAGTHFNMLFLTPDNLDSTWLHFEAGAIAAKIGKGSVCPVLFGVAKTELGYPLAGMQATSFEKSDTLKLLRSINNALGAEALKDQTLGSAFEKWWPDLERAIKAILKAPAAPVVPKKSSDELLREILEGVRDLGAQLSQSRPTNKPEAYRPIERIDALLLSELVELCTLIGRTIKKQYNDGEEVWKETTADLWKQSFRLNEILELLAKSVSPRQDSLIKQVLEMRRMLEH